MIASLSDSLQVTIIETTGPILGQTLGTQYSQQFAASLTANVVASLSTQLTQLTISLQSGGGVCKPANAVPDVACLSTPVLDFWS